MTCHHICRAGSCALFAALLFVAAAAAAQQPGGNNNQPDTPGTGRFPAIKEEVASLPAASVAVSWLAWQLRADARWTLERKQFPAAAGH